MALPSAYLTTTKNLGRILAAIQNAQAPKQFSTRFIASLGNPSEAMKRVENCLGACAFCIAARIRPRFFVVVRYADGRAITRSEKGWTTLNGTAYYRAQRDERIKAVPPGWLSLRNAY